MDLLDDDISTNNLNPIAVKMDTEGYEPNELDEGSVATFSCMEVFLMTGPIFPKASKVAGMKIYLITEKGGDAVGFIL